MPYTVLLIEDEGLIRMATAAMLEDAGYCVLEAVNCDEALIILQANAAVDIVVTDVQMPGKLDGLALVKVIGRDYPNIHTLVTSGRTGLREASLCGATKFLAKPYTALAIQEAVNAAIRQTG